MRRQDIDILYNFMKLKEPDFIINLGLRYDIDYYYGIIKQILNKQKKLTANIEDFDINTKIKIANYIKKHGNQEDKIFFYMMETVFSIFCKYYNEDGTLK